MAAVGEDLDVGVVDRAQHPLGAVGVDHPIVLAPDEKERMIDRLQIERALELGQEPAADVEDPHAALERADVLGKRGDGRMIDASLVVEHERAVDTADDLADEDLGNGQRR